MNDPIPAPKSGLQTALAGMPEKLASRKLVVALVAMLIVVLNKRWHLGLEASDVLAIATMAGSYVVGQGIVDSRKP